MKVLIVVLAIHLSASMPVLVTEQESITTEHSERPRLKREVILAEGLAWAPETQETKTFQLSHPTRAGLAKQASVKVPQKTYRNRYRPKPAGKNLRKQFRKLPENQNRFVRKQQGEDDLRKFNSKIHESRSDKLRMQQPPGISIASVDKNSLEYHLNRNIYDPLFRIPQPSSNERFQSKLPESIKFFQRLKYSDSYSQPSRSSQNINYGSQIHSPVSSNFNGLRFPHFSSTSSVHLKPAYSKASSNVFLAANENFGRRHLIPSKRMQRPRVFTERKRIRNDVLKAPVIGGNTRRLWSEDSRLKSPTTEAEKQSFPPISKSNTLDRGFMSHRKESKMSHAPLSQMKKTFLQDIKELHGQKERMKSVSDEPMMPGKPVENFLGMKNSEDLDNVISIERSVNVSMLREKSTQGSMNNFGSEIPRPAKSTVTRKIFSEPTESDPPITMKSTDTFKTLEFTKATKSVHENFKSTATKQFPLQNTKSILGNALSITTLRLPMTGPQTFTEGQKPTSTTLPTTISEISNENQRFQPDTSRSAKNDLEESALEQPINKVMSPIGIKRPLKRLPTTITGSDFESSDSTIMAGRPNKYFEGLTTTEIGIIGVDMTATEQPPELERSAGLPSEDGLESSTTVATGRRSDDFEPTNFVTGGHLKEDFESTTTATAAAGRLLQEDALDSTTTAANERPLEEEALELTTVVNERPLEEEALESTTTAANELPLEEEALESTAAVANERPLEKEALESTTVVTGRLEEDALESTMTMTVVTDRSLEEDSLESTTVANERPLEEDGLESTTVANEHPLEEEALESTTTVANERPLEEDGLESTTTVANERPLEEEALESTTTVANERPLEEDGLESTTTVANGRPLEEDGLGSTTVANGRPLEEDGLESTTVANERPLEKALESSTTTVANERPLEEALESTTTVANERPLEEEALESTTTVANERPPEEEALESTTTVANERPLEEEALESTTTMTATVANDRSLEEDSLESTTTVANERPLEGNGLESTTTVANERPLEGNGLESTTVATEHPLEGDSLESTMTTTVATDRFLEDCLESTTVANERPLGEEAFESTTTVATGRYLDDGFESTTTVAAGRPLDDGLESTTGVATGRPLDDGLESTTAVMTGRLLDDGLESTTVATGRPLNDDLESTTTVATGRPLDDGLESTTAVVTGRLLDDGLESTTVATGRPLNDDLELTATDATGHPLDDGLESTTGVATRRPLDDGLESTTTVATGRPLDDGLESTTTVATGRPLDDGLELTATDATGRLLDDGLELTTVATGRPLNDDLELTATDATGHPLDDGLELTTVATGRPLDDGLELTTVATGGLLVEDGFKSTTSGATGRPLADGLELTTTDATGHPLVDGWELTTDASGHPLDDGLKSTTDATGDTFGWELTTDTTGRPLDDGLESTTAATGRTLDDGLESTTDTTGRPLDDGLESTTAATGPTLDDGLESTNVATGRPLDDGLESTTTMATGNPLDDGLESTTSSGLIFNVENTGPINTSQFNVFELQRISSVSVTEPSSNVSDLNLDYSKNKNESSFLTRQLSSMVSSDFAVQDAFPSPASSDLKFNESESFNLQVSKPRSSQSLEPETYNSSMINLLNLETTIITSTENASTVNFSINSQRNEVYVSNTDTPTLSSELSFDTSSTEMPVSTSNKGESFSTDYFLKFGRADSGYHTAYQSNEFSTTSVTDTDNFTGPSDRENMFKESPLSREFRSTMPDDPLYESDCSVAPYEHPKTEDASQSFVS